MGISKKLLLVDLDWEIAIVRKILSILGIAPSNDQYSKIKFICVIFLLFSVVLSSILKISHLIENEDPTYPIFVATYFISVVSQLCLFQINKKNFNICFHIVTNNCHRALYFPHSYQTILSSYFELTRRQIQLSFIAIFLAAVGKLEKA